MPKPIRGTGLRIGLAKTIAGLNVGLEVMLTDLGNEPPEKEPPIVGEEAAELALEPGMLIGIAMGSRLFRTFMGDPMVD
jgi:hypothetical protein